MQLFHLPPSIFLSCHCYCRWSLPSATTSWARIVLKWPLKSHWCLLWTMWSKMMVAMRSQVRKERKNLNLPSQRRSQWIVLAVDSRSASSRATRSLSLDFEQGLGCKNQTASMSQILQTYHTTYHLTWFMFVPIKLFLPDRLDTTSEGGVKTISPIRPVACLAGQLDLGASVTRLM